MNLKAKPVTPGQRLRHARLSKKIKLVDLAKKINRTPQAIGDYERDRRGWKRPDMALLCSLCIELELSIDYLFLGKEPNKK
ncbi:MAG TPA: helix-turn-helix transcriptional regulator [Hanamia sp.]|jgi:Helix-turn-helix.|nr:helix-turn-helix transcriptional regulator [Hanamia sp.]